MDLSLQEQSYRVKTTHTDGSIQVFGKSYFLLPY
jgi:hypothetical protein